MEENMESQTQEQASNRLVDVDVNVQEKEVGAGAATTTTTRGKPPLIPRKRKRGTDASSDKEEAAAIERAKTSECWKYFYPAIVVTDEYGSEKIKAKCKICGTFIAADPALNGTSGMNSHMRTCLKREAKKKNGGQTVLSFQENVEGSTGGMLTVWKFDQTACRIALVEMIILDELPFRFVEREGFKKFVEKLQPQFRIPGRHTIRADCVKMFMEKKIIMKSFFQSKGMGRVSITTDCWTACNNTNFICVTAHFIDKEWNLHKKIINFRKICSHKGNDLGASVISSLEEWGLQRILCCTMDNASANDGCIKYMKPIIEGWNTSVVGGKYLHVRCVAHILNLIVHDGLEEIGLSVRRVREAVKWIGGSPLRTEEFKNIATAIHIDCSKALCLDMPTRWNSTYLMLEAAIPYEGAFKYFTGMHADFVKEMDQKSYKDKPIGIPEEQDWVQVKRMMDYLGKFFDLTVLVSGTTYVTSHQFFMQMCGIFELISDLEMDIDEDVSMMATKMKTKLGKYWLETNELNPKMNKILYIAALFDPRQKMKHIEKCLKSIYDAKRATELVQEVNNSMHELFELYKKEITPISTPRPTASSSIATVGRRDRRGRAASCTFSGVADTESESSDNSELTNYLSEKQYVMTKEEIQIQEETDQWDILNWWMKNGPRFPVLSEMARDILAIPISSVASEAAFSTGGRVLSSFRSSLTPSMVEALICAEDWLRSSSVDIYLKDEEDVPQTELEKEFESVIATLGVSGGELGDQSGSTSVGGTTDSDNVV